MLPTPIEVGPGQAISLMVLAYRSSQLDSVHRQSYSTHVVYVNLEQGYQALFILGLLFLLDIWYHFI